MDRRHIVSGCLAAGVAAAFAPAPARGAQSADDLRTAAAVDQLREAVDRGFRVSPELTRIREQQRTFLKANHRFPDFIEVGIGVWEDLYDSHVRHQRPMQVIRTAEGRYAIQLMETTLVLRPEQTENYVGFGFDAR